MVHCTDHLWITLPDGARLGARLWLPSSPPLQPVPAILEYIPYRKDDYTALRDASTIAWFAGHGYACIRVDMRGSGSSDGVLCDEYTEQEIDDGVAVIHWISEQAWCDGNVGTIGISWGGITGLQLAQRAPQPLKTVIALGATEHRYYDDGGYYLGCMVGQTLGWAAIMFGYNTRPPDPALVGDGWRERWLERLDQAPHFLECWLSHQREDDYWLRGSVGNNYDAIRIPIYAVSGHADCWPNTVARLLAHLRVPRRGLQGPWCHRYPHLGIPGPTVGFLGDALRWFDRWLKNIPNEIMQEATYQVYIQDSVRPQPFYDSRPGRWVGEESWPSAQVENQTYHLGDSGLNIRPMDGSVVSICSPQSVGLAGGEYMPWFAFGAADELPDDQRIEDEGSLQFDTPALSAAIEILGNAVFEVTLSCDQAQGLLAVRLCDVWPDGASTLITRAVCNLCHRNSKREPEALVAGQRYTVEIVLDHVGYKIPPGHRLRLAVSTSYWPMAWPSPVQATVNVFTASSQLRLPVRRPDALDGTLTRFTSDAMPQPLAVTTLRPFSQQRVVHVDPDDQRYVLEIVTDNGRVRFDANQLQMGSTTLQRYSIGTDDPLSAQAEYEWEWEYGRGTEWQVRTHTRTVVRCDARYFYLQAESVAWEQDTEVFRKRTSQRYLRDFF